MDHDVILQVRDLSITIDGNNILNNISFSVKKGEALAIIGPNGAGKTMLLRALLGVVPHQGTIQWSSGAHIAYIPQKFVIDKTIPATTLEFFLLQSGNFWMPDKTTVDHLNHELELVGLDATILRQPISELSGGQFQRVLIAWSMLNHPDALLFDEPTSGIDVGAEETIYNIIHKLQDERGTTVILISHDLNIIYRYAQTVVCLNKTMICAGEPIEVLTPSELSKIYGGGKFYHHMGNSKH